MWIPEHSHQSKDFKVILCHQRWKKKSIIWKNTPMTNYISSHFLQHVWVKINLSDFFLHIFSIHHNFLEIPRHLQPFLAHIGLNYARYTLSQGERMEVNCQIHTYRLTVSHNLHDTGVKILKQSCRDNPQLLHQSV